MKLVVNGKEREERNVEKLSDLLARLGIGEEAAGVAVALNDRVVPRGKWRETPLAEGDRVEIITAVQGG